MCVKSVLEILGRTETQCAKHQSDIKQVMLKNSPKNFLSQQSDAQINPNLSLVNSAVLEQSSYI